MTEPIAEPLDLWADGDVEWRPVSPRLARVRRLVAHLSYAPFVLAGAVVGALWWRWAAIPAALLLLPRSARAQEEAPTPLRIGTSAFRKSAPSAMSPMTGRALMKAARSQFWPTLS